MPEVEVTITENTVEVVRTENAVEVTAPGPQGASGGGSSLTQGTLAGRGAASGTGQAEQITLGTGLSMSGTTLNAAGGDHGTLTGLGDDDHAQYLLINPEDSARNLMLPKADITAITINVDAGQASDTSVIRVNDLDGFLAWEVRSDDGGNNTMVLRGTAVLSTVFLPTNALSPTNGVRLSCANVTSSAWILRFPSTWPSAAGQVMASGGSGTPVDTTWVDHGGIGGLGDDDHPQYYNQARGDARYSQLGHTHNAAGSNTQVQYNSSNAFAGSADFTFDNSSKVVQVGSASTKGIVSVRHQGEVRFYESNANGSNYVYVYGPGSLTSNHGYILPSTLPTGIPLTPGLYVLSGTETGGVVTLSWATITGQQLTEYANNEVPAGTVNGSNNTFTVNGGGSIYVGTLRLYKNGIRQTPGSGNDYTVTEGTGTIVFEAGNIPQTGDTLLADYKPEGIA